MRSIETNATVERGKNNGPWCHVFNHYCQYTKQKRLPTWILTPSRGFDTPTRRHLYKKTRDTIDEMPRKVCLRCDLHIKSVLMKKTKVLFGIFIFFKATFFTWSFVFNIGDYLQDVSNFIFMILIGKYRLTLEII